MDDDMVVALVVAVGELGCDWDYTKLPKHRVAKDRSRIFHVR